MFLCRLIPGTGTFLWGREVTQTENASEKGDWLRAQNGLELLQNSTRRGACPLSRAQHRLSERSADPPVADRDSRLAY